MHTPHPTAPARRAGLLLREGLLHLVLLALVLAATLAGYQARAPLVIDARFEPDRVFSGFNEIEYEDGMAFRWTGGAGQICAEQVGYPARAVLRVTLLGKGAHALGIDQVTFVVNKQPVASAPIRPALHTYDLLLDRSHLTGDDLCVELRSEIGARDADQRAFGVPFQQLTLYRSLHPGDERMGLVLPALRLLALNVVVALLGFWLLRALRVSGGLALLAVGTLAASTGALVALGVVAPRMDVARNLQPTAGLLALTLAGVLATRAALPRLTPAQVGWWGTRLGRDMLALAAWSVLLVGSVRVLQLGYGHSGVWPLKAGVWIELTPGVLLALAGLVLPLFAAWLTLLLAALRRARPPGALVGLALLLYGGVALPVVLKASVRGLDSLYWTFRDNLSDYIQDVPRVDEPLRFLGRYVELSPTLAWHNSNHPPGSVLLLWLVEQATGGGYVTGTWAAILLSSLVALAAYWLGTRLGGRQVALLAGALVVVMPGHQIYSVTSMDGVFNALNALAAVAFFLALEPGARAWRALLAGALLALALFFTYATTQLFFFGLALCGLALLRAETPGAGLRHALRQGALAAGTLVVLYALLYAASGFNIIEATLQAKANNARLLSADPTNPDPDLMGLPSVSQYVFFLGVNIVPFLWYLAPWGLAALTPWVLAAVRGWRRPNSAQSLALALCGLVLGMWLSGLFLREVERIWGFVYPLAAVLIALHVWQGPTTRRVRLWRAGLWVSLFFAQSLLFRLLLNTYW